MIERDTIYIYIYIYMYIYIYTYMHIHRCTYMYIYIYCAAARCTSSAIAGMQAPMRERKPSLLVVVRDGTVRWSSIRISNMGRARGDQSGSGSPGVSVQTMTELLTLPTSAEVKSTPALLLRQADADIQQLPSDIHQVCIVECLYVCMYV